ncbi:MAG: hypothetical protein BWY74_01985 [Firmicutes bacterium ADurb.Bin419]|nr:MAG: hypothetical protein BWY74_01985 [Firmicutes bacterium ADurb.Bin419]
MNLNFRTSTQVKDIESASETVLLTESLNNSATAKNATKPNPNTKSQDNNENFDTFIEKIK